MNVSTSYTENEIVNRTLNLKKLYHFSWSNENDYSCSKSFLDKTKTTLNEILNLPFKHYSLIDKSESVKDIGKDFYNKLKDNLEKDNTKEIELTYKIKIKDDQFIWIKEVASIKTDEDNTQKIVSFAFEITELKQKEIELNKVITEKTRLNKAKDKLISIISHDLRSPFTSLLGFTEILLSEPDLPVEERIEFIQYIHDASKIQLEMVNHLLDWTHLQNGTMKFSPKELDISNIAASCISVLTGVSINKNIEVKFEGKPKQIAFADERLITQVITNLLSNALKFTPEGKKITIGINSFSDNEIEIIVKDEGVGISENDQEKIFNIDTKFSKAGTAGEKGSGLGLTLVKEIVEKHNGQIWFDSKINEGSEFHLILPTVETFKNNGY